MLAAMNAFVPPEITGKQIKSVHPRPIPTSLELQTSFYACDLRWDAAELLSEFIHVRLAASHGLSDLTRFLTAQVMIFFLKAFVKIVFPFRLRFHLLSHFGLPELPSFIRNDQLYQLSEF
jgi:hypothetical protein